ncbi:MAG: tRNA uridine-5-carboxymethylaminomethyl(34) synthesis GTPase MnmE [Pseudomonadota bacterium]
MAADQDTIFALASGALPSAIALVRLSGSRALEICDDLVSGGPLEHSVASLREVRSGSGALIDQAVVTAFHSPRSYTGEHTVELSLHGGGYVVEQVYERLSELGARLAEPGEFTRRAFEAGKMDLTQAEAVADLIDAESEAQHKQALQQLGGSLSNLYQIWHENLVRALASLEVYIDFPDEGDVGTEDTGPVLNRLRILSADFERSLSQSAGAERVREGFLIAILGPPNAGKSSLLNALAGYDAAIVTPIPGTTRDFVETKLRIGPYLVRLSDTAGLRETSDEVEKIGVERAHKRAEEADLRIWLIPADGYEQDSFKVIQKDISVLSKSDLISERNVSRETLSISSKTGYGLSDLKSFIEERLNALARPGIMPSLTQFRHRAAIEKANTHISDAIAKIETHTLLDLAAEDVRLAARAIASLVGHIDVEQVLGSIFSDFCIGK